MDDALEHELSELPVSKLLPELERALALLFEESIFYRELREEQYRGALLRIVKMLRGRAEPIIPLLLRQERRKLSDGRFNDGVAYDYTVGALGFVAWTYARPLLASEDAVDRRVGQGVLDGLTKTEGLTREERITVSRDITNDHTLGEWSWETECLLKGIVYLRVVDHRAVARIKALCTTAEEWSQRTLCDGFLKKVEPVGQIK